MDPFLGHRRYCSFCMHERFESVKTKLKSEISAIPLLNHLLPRCTGWMPPSYLSASAELFEAGKDVAVTATRFRPQRYAPIIDLTISVVYGLGIVCHGLELLKPDRCRDLV